MGKEKKNLKLIHMWQFIMGFASGLYVGSYYECKPTIQYIVKIIKDNAPKEKK